MPAPLSRKVIAEFLGTFIFVLVGAGAAVGARAQGVSDPGSSLIIAALANGLGIAMAVSATMGISGGSLNPAITIGLFVARKLELREVVPYILAELAGAIAAVAALVLSIPTAIGNPVKWGSPALLGSLSVAQGVGLEALLTFVLAITVFGSAIDPRAPKVAGLAIGFAVVVDVFLGGPLTGAAMNPARAMGPMLAGNFIPSYWYIYWVGPLIGAVAASLAYRFVLESTP